MRYPGGDWEELDRQEIKEGKDLPWPEKGIRGRSIRLQRPALAGEVSRR